MSVGHRNDGFEAGFTLHPSQDALFRIISVIWANEVDPNVLASFGRINYSAWIA
jgi:hypothetical protein